MRAKLEEKKKKKIRAIIFLYTVNGIFNAQNFDLNGSRSSFML